IAVALREQYMPRHASDALPQSALGQVLAVAERIDTLVGIFAIGQKPTGVKDPFALRRAALGALRVLIECELSVDLQELIAIAAAQFESDVQAQECADELLDFMLERLRAYYLESGVSPQVFDAVLANRPTSPLDFSRRLLAVQHFAQLPEAESLVAANKRTRNILKKVENINLTTVDESLFEEAQESELYASLKSHSASVQPAFESGDYASALKILAGLREPIDAFFDGVMVNADDENVRNNRLALLRDLSDLFGHVADISRLSGA
ncbi:MAG: glycine--tRNA ligase subunit beta, partial [Pseudomonadota bacterium]